MQQRASAHSRHSLGRAMPNLCWRPALRAAGMGLRRAYDFRRAVGRLHRSPAELLDEGPVTLPALHSGEKAAVRVSAYIHTTILLFAAWPAAKRSADVLHQENEMQVIGRLGPNFRHEVTGEYMRLLGVRMNEQPAAADVVGEVQLAGEHVLEQGRFAPRPSQVVSTPSRANRTTDWMPRRVDRPQATAAEPRSSAFSTTLWHRSAGVSCNLPSSVLIVLPSKVGRARCAQTHVALPGHRMPSIQALRFSRRGGAVLLLSAESMNVIEVAHGAIHRGHTPPTGTRPE
jgi:hypothetical protein